MTWEELEKKIKDLGNRSYKTTATFWDPNQDECYPLVMECTDSEDTDSPIGPDRLFLKISKDGEMPGWDDLIACELEEPDSQNPVYVQLENGSFIPVGFDETDDLDGGALGKLHENVKSEHPYLFEVKS